MRTKQSIGLLAAIFMSLAVFPSERLQAADTHRLLNLRGNWKFNLGDNPRYSDSKFDDAEWSSIYVPSTWEEEGYPGYDGYAWYRKHFKATDSWRTKDLLLELGMIDDVDEVYVNGQFVGGTGSFPPEFETAYNAGREYSIPYALLDPDGDNVVAVRVYDDHGVGGIVDGQVGVYERRYFVDPDIALPITWKFKTGDDMKWKETGYDDTDWNEVRVPAHWENQGFKDYDGYAWYRVTFNAPKEYMEDDLIMLVGKIDDFDEVYLNGTRIGRTGTMPKYKMTHTNSDEYSQMRAYMIPDGLMRFDGKNVLAVRVYDCWQGGGIYEGPVGIVTRQHYRVRNYRHTYRKVESWFENLFDDIFD